MWIMPTPIDVTLTPEAQQQIQEAFNTIRSQMPFLLTLTPTQRQQLPKMGDKSRAFVRKALSVAQQNPDILPRSFDPGELERDVELFEAVYPLMLATAQLLEMLDDTLMAVGSEAYVAALKVYNYTKVSGQVDGLDAAIEEMSERFAKKRRPVAE